MSAIFLFIIGLLVTIIGPEFLDTLTSVFNGFGGTAAMILSAPLALGAMLSPFRLAA